MEIQIGRQRSRRSILTLPPLQPIARCPAFSVQYHGLRVPAAHVEFDNCLHPGMQPHVACCHGRPLPVHRALLATTQASSYPCLSLCEETRNLDSRTALPFSIGLGFNLLVAAPYASYLVSFPSHVCLRHLSRSLSCSFARHISMFAPRFLPYHHLFALATSD